MIEKPNVRFHDGQILSEEPLNKAMVAVDDCVDAANDATTKAETAETAATNAQSSASSAAESSAAIQQALEEIKGSGDIPAATIAKVAVLEVEIATLGSDMNSFHEFENNYKYVKKVVDKDGKIILSINKNGEQEVHVPTKFHSKLQIGDNDVLSLEDFFENNCYISITIDKDRKILEAVSKDGKTHCFAPYKFVKGFEISDTHVEEQSNPYAKIVIDNDNNLIEAITKTGDKIVFGNEEVKGVLEAKALGNNLSTLIKNLKVSKLAKSKTFKGNLANGEVIDLGLCHVKSNKRISFVGNVSSFNELLVGNGVTSGGQGAYNGSYFKITNTSVEVYEDLYTTIHKAATYTHGLTISNNIQVLIDIDEKGICSLSICSNGSSVTIAAKEFVGSNGNVFCKSINSVLTKCVLSMTCTGFTKDIQVYGDSYLGLGSANRWASYLVNDGFGRSALFDGFAGCGSNNAYQSFLENIKFNIPKYVVWLLGMNDVDANNTINANWLSCVNNVRSKCEELGIELVLATIPSVVGGYSADSGISDKRIHKPKNDYVKSSGLRYIDFASAVGASDVDGTWYNNGQSNDMLEDQVSGTNHTRVHPTEYGAKALYYQFIADFPEIMFNK